MKTFIAKNYNLVAGIIAALVLVMQQTLQNSSNPVDLKAIGLAALLAILGVLGNQWKGKGITLAGIIGTLSYTFTTIYSSGSFTWNQFTLLAVLSVLTTLSEGIKSYDPNK